MMSPTPFAQPSAQNHENAVQVHTANPLDTNRTISPRLIQHLGADPANSFTARKPASLGRSKTGEMVSGSNRNLSKHLLDHVKYPQNLGSKRDTGIIENCRRTRCSLFGRWEKAAHDDPMCWTKGMSTWSTATVVDDAGLCEAQIETIVSRENLL